MENYCLRSYLLTFGSAPVFYPATTTPSSAQAQDTIVDSAKVAPLDPSTEKSA